MFKFITALLFVFFLASVFAASSIDRSSDMPGWIRISSNNDYNVYANFEKKRIQKMEIGKNILGC